VALRRSVTLEIAGHEISLDVTNRVVYVLDEVYGENLEYVIGVELALPMRWKRSKIAECIADIIAVAPAASKLQLKRREVLDWVIGASPEELKKYVGVLQALALSCLRAEDGSGNPRISDEEFQTIVSGGDLKPRGGNGLDTTEKKDPAPGSSMPATTSP
jgi:hypothetical protein